jgi:hypothetical protein
VDGDEGRRGRPPDPLGKRALYWLEASGADEVAHPAAGPHPLGKRALYSEAPAARGEETADGDHPEVERGAITVTCSACGAVSHIGLLDLLIYQLPFGYWLPRGRFDHKMTCPSCRRRVWVGVSVRRT